MTCPICGLATLHAKGLLFIDTGATEHVCDGCLAWFASIVRHFCPPRADR